jgi:PKD repeat protein
MKQFIAVFTIVVFSLAGCGKKNAANRDPVTITPAAPLKAGFTIDNQEYVKEGTPAQFRNTSTSAVSYRWDFGTGDLSTEKEPVFTFSGCGPRTITLLVTDAAGNQKSFTVELEVRCTGKHVPQGG